MQTRKISKKWSAKYRRELEEKLETETKHANNVKQSGQGFKLKGFRIFSQRCNTGENEQNNVDALPKSPSGRLTKYFSGKLKKYFSKRKDSKINLSMIEH